MNPVKKPDLSKLDILENPYVSSLVINANKLVRNNEYKKDEDLLIPVDFLVEYTPSVNLYRFKEIRLNLMKLKPTSCKMFLWITQTIDTNKDYLWINRVRCMEELEIGKNTYLRSITDLIDYNILLPTSIQDTYWINPQIFFPGNRIKKYPNNIIIKQDRTDE